MRDWNAYVRAHLPSTDLEPAREARVVRELASQLEDFYREAMARGDDDAAADAFARAQISDWHRMARDVRRAGHVRPAVDRLIDRVETAPQTARTRSALMLTHVLRDARYATRQLIKAPGFTGVAVLTLALGIGATTAIFSVVNAVLLRPLPYAAPDTLVRVHEVVPQYGRFAVAPATFLDWRQQSASFARIAAYSSVSATLMLADGPERISGLATSWDLFELLGVVPAMGAAFTAAQDAPGASGVLVISHALWQRRFGGDPSIVGRSITMNGAPATIVGVMPEHFYFPTRMAEFWQPLALDTAKASRGAHYLGVIARLAPGRDQDAAAAEIRTISERLATQYPDSANESAEVVLLHEQMVGAIRPALVTLLAAVTVVVMIACANVANLLLVRASLRAKEVAIRTALGAGRARLTLQMLVESGMLAVAGGAAGLLLARVAIPWIKSMGGTSIPRVADIGVDVGVLGFTAGISIVTGLLFGLAPAWQARRAHAADALKESGRSSTTAGGRWLRTTLLVGEVALSVVLLVGAALFLRSFARLTNVDPGFDPEHVLAFQVSLPGTSYSSTAQRLAFFDTLETRLAALPAVRSAGAAQRLPLVGGYVLSFAIHGRPPARPGEEPSANHRVVTPQYFQSVGIPLRRGRLFTTHDTDRAPMVAVIDEAFARRHFADEDPIGQGLDIGNGTDGVYEIVGIVGDVRNGGLDTVPAPTMYVPYKQDVFSTMWIVVRGERDPLHLVGDIRRVLREIDPTLPAYSVQPLANVLSDSIAARRFSMLLLTLFASVALVLATVGLYGVVAYSVSQRTREIGLRVAVGAARLDILRLIVGGGMKYAAAGMAIGLGAAIALGQFVESMLFEVSTTDAVSYAGTAALLLVVAVLACYVPARRAMRVDPIVTLQSE